MSKHNFFSKTVDIAKTVYYNINADMELNQTLRLIYVSNIYILWHVFLYAKYFATCGSNAQTQFDAEYHNN